MKSILTGFVSLLLFVVATVHAQEDVFDYSDKIAWAIKDISSGARMSSIKVCKELYSSGISDPELAAVISEKLLANHQTTKAVDKMGVEYSSWLAKALASQGIPEYAATLETVIEDTQSKKIRRHAQNQYNKIEWFKQFNAIVSSKKYHAEGDNPRVSQLMNLIMSNDFSFKRTGAERMNWEKILDSRLMEEMEQQLLEFHDKTGKNKEKIQAMAWYAKMLGHSGQEKYRATLKKVKKSKAHSTIKKHTAVALRKLG